MTGRSKAIILGLGLTAWACAIGATPLRGNAVRDHRPEIVQQQLITTGLRAWEDRNLTRAETAFKALQTLNHSLELPYVGLMLISLQRSDFLQALDWANRAPATVRNSASIRLLEAQATDVLRGPHAALKVLADGGPDCSLRTARGAYFMRLQRSLDALAMYTDVLRDCPGRIDAALGFVLSAALTGRFISAWDVYWQIEAHLPSATRYETRSYLYWLEVPRS